MAANAERTNIEAWLQNTGKISQWPDHIKIPEGIHLGTILVHQAVEILNLT